MAIQDMQEEPTGEFLAAIARGEVELNPHMTAEQRKSSRSMCIFDAVVAKDMAHVEAERRELTDKTGRQTTP